MHLTGNEEGQTCAGYMCCQVLLPQEQANPPPLPQNPACVPPTPAPRLACRQRPGPEWQLAIAASKALASLSLFHPTLQGAKEKRAEAHLAPSLLSSSPHPHLEGFVLPGQPAKGKKRLDWGQGMHSCAAVHGGAS